MGGENSRARRSEAKCDGVHTARAERAPASYLYVHPVYWRFIHGPRGIFREAWLRLRVGGRARAREFRRGVRAVCERRQRRLRRGGMAGETAVLQRQSDDVGRFLRGI